MQMLLVIVYVHNSQFHYGTYLAMCKQTLLYLCMYAHGYKGCRQQEGDFEVRIFMLRYLK